MIDALSLFLLSVLYLGSRFYQLTTMPVFGDEAIYTRWSQIIKTVETLRFIPLTDGKQPFYMWLTVPFFKIFSDPLFASRAVSVFAGLGTMIFIYIILKYVFKKPTSIAFLGSYIYLTSFFSFFFDRLGTADNLLSLFVTSSLLFTLLLAKYPRLDLSLILGGNLGLAWLTKSPAIYFIVLNFVIFGIYNYSKIYKFIYPAISTFIAFSFYNILRLGPQFSQIKIRNQDYVWPLTTVLTHPLDPFKPHLSDTITIYQQYFPPLLLSITLLLGTFYLSKKPKINLAVVSTGLWYLLPLIATLAFAKVFTARYILFTLPPLILLLSLLFSQFSKSRYINLAIIFYFSLNFIKIYHFQSQPFTFKLPSTETGYLQDWTSGWGIKDSASFLINRAKVANVIVGTEGYFGTLPDGLQIYTNNVKQLTVFGVGIGFEKIPDKLIDAYNHGDEVYILANRSRLRLTTTELEKLSLVQKYPKPNNDELILYRL